jgi:cyclopropane-fatty-acyl-phospholipid synthase
MASIAREIERLVPDRPFTIQFWDGTAIPATRPGGPTLTVRSPRAIAHALRAPGQLGLSRAYVSGELEVDDLDALVHLFDIWNPPVLDARSRVRLYLAAARAAGTIRRAPAPAVERRLRRARHERD